MARISTYELDGKVNGGDKWIGTDSGSFNTTKNFTPIRLAEYFNSSEKIDLSNSLRFYYQIPEVEEDRATGTISFESFLGYNIPLSDLSYILLSKTTEGGIQVSDFLSAINNYKVLLHKGDSINVYGIYEVTSIEDWEVNADFLKVGLSFIRGNGELANGSSYLLSVVDFNLAVDVSWGNITGNIQSQEDLQDALSLKANNSDLGEVAFSNDYNDLDNLPNIPSIDNLVPYAGATQNVDLGEHQIKAGQLELDLTPTQTFGVGKIRWNDSAGTAEIRLKGNNVTLQIGQELVKRVVNKTATNINLLESNYQVVKIVGAQGQRLAIDLAQANNDLNSATTLGVVTENINNNQEGFITYSGEVNLINTTGSLQGETWNDGDVLYLSPTIAGRLTNVKPTAPNHIVTIGYVEYAHNINGKIFVKVDNGYELEELHNVTETNYTTPIDTDSLLTFDVTNSLWKRLSWANIKSNLKTYFDTIYQTALGFTPENIANKATNLTSPDNTKYPTTLAISTALSGKQDTLTNPITGTGANGQVAFFNGTTTQTSDNVFVWDNINKRLGVGSSATPQARLDVRAQDALATDIPFRVRNSTDTANLLSVNGLGITTINGVNENVQLRITNTGTANNRSAIAFQFNNSGVDQAMIRALPGIIVGSYGRFAISTYNVFGGGMVDRMLFDEFGGVSIGASYAQNVAIPARLDVRAQGALSTDIAFRVRNSADTANLIDVNGTGGVSINSTGTQIPLTLKGTSSNNTIILNHAGKANAIQLNNNAGTPIESGVIGWANSNNDIVSLRNSFYFLVNNQNVPTANIKFTRYVGGVNVLVDGMFASSGNFLLNTTTDIASSQLTIESTTKGFLPPRMTTTQRDAIATPAAGLIVYDTTDNKHYGYNGTSWYTMDADIVTTNRQSASYTLTLTDRNKLVEMDVATANNLTIPLNSSVAFPIGTKIDVVQYGAGQTTFVPVSGVTIRSANNWLKMNARYGAATLTKIGTDEWYLWGNLNA